MTSIPGWTAATGTFDQTNGCCGSFAPPAPGTGSWYVDLVGSEGSGGVKQTFATVAGTAYTLSFDYSRNYSVTPNGASALVTAVGNSVDFSTTITHSDASFSNPTGFNNMNWVDFSAEFTADSSTTTLTFLNTVGAFNGGIFLDAVSVDPLDASTPLPAALPLFTTGLGVMGLLGWRRKRKASVGA